MCETRRVSRRILDGMPTDEIVFTHADCVCNEVLALTNRHQAKVPEAKRPWQHLQVPPGYDIEVEPWTRTQMVNHYSGPKRARYQRAYESLEHDNVTRQDAKLKMFLKPEKYHVGEDVKHKPPRCIQYRSERYGLELGKYIHALEAEVYKITDKSDTPVFAKSRNSVQRAADLAAKAAMYADPVYVLLDQSGWDAHVNETLLTYEHKLYSTMLDSDHMRFLLSLQTKNVGATKNGTRYQTPFTRMSGDMNTALGNCVINHALLYGWATESGLDACYYIDGDDSVVVIDRSQLDRAIGAQPGKWFLKWGMESKIDWADQFEHCEFCQSRPVWDGVGWRMVRNPERFFIRSQWTTGPHHENFFPRLVASIAKCEMAMSVGIPIINPLANNMLAASGLDPNVKVWRGVDRYFKARWEAWSPDRAHLATREISEESRLSMEAAWGYSPALQIEMEQRQLKLSLTTVDDWTIYLKHFAADNFAG